MNYQEIVNKIKPDLERALGRFKEELSKIRTGRATPALVEDIEVDYYGTRMSIKQLATISIPEPRSIIIKPWDKTVLGILEKALSLSGVGLNPIVDGEQIRIVLPPMSEERREEFSKIVRQKTEETRQVVRKLRDEAWGKIQELQRAGDIGEDDKFRGKDELQKLIDDHNAKVEEMGDKKEEEIMTV